MNVKWMSTDEATYTLIWLKHKDSFQVFETFTNMESNSRFGNPKKLTTWGFIESSVPLIKRVESKDDDEQKEWDQRFYIAYVVKDPAEEVE